MRRALQVAKARGKKLGTQNRKVKGKGAKARRQQAEALAVKLCCVIKPLWAAGYGGKSMTKFLNRSSKAVKLNNDQPFHLSKVQRLYKTLLRLKLLLRRKLK